MDKKNRIKFFKILNNCITFLLIITLIEGIIIRPKLINNQFNKFNDIVFSVLLTINILSLPFYNFSLRFWPRKKIRIEYWQAVESGNKKYFIKRILIIYGLYLFIFVVGLIYNYLKY